MKIATRLSSPKSRQFIAGDVSKKGDSPGGTGEPRYKAYWLPQVEERPVDPNHTVPTGRVAFWDGPRQ